MGNAGKSVKRVTQGLQDAAGDVGKGIQQISEGQIERGLTNIGVGTTNLSSGGMSLTASGQGIQGETELTRMAQNEANQAAQDVVDAANAKEASRRETIKNRLDEEIKLRQKSPGRSQTLLTTGMTPSASQTNTLLTSAVRGMR